MPRHRSKSNSQALQAGDYVMMRAKDKWDPAYGLGDEFGQVQSVDRDACDVVWSGGSRHTFGVTVLRKIKPTAHEKAAIDEILKRPRSSFPGYSNYGGGGPFAPFSGPQK